jgi:hypothetical protein
MKKIIFTIITILSVIFLQVQAQSFRKLNIGSDTINIDAGVTYEIQPNTAGGSFEIFRGNVSQGVFNYTNTITTIVGLKLNKSELSLGYGEPFTLLPTVVPVQTVTYASGNEAIASVDSTGLITGISEGTTTITASTPDGQTAVCEVTVQTLLQRISAMSGTTATLVLFADETLSPLKLANNTNLTLTGDEEERIVRLASKGRLFTLPATTSLTLEDNVTLKGMTKNIDGASEDNNDCLIAVGGTLTMKEGSKITGNTVGAGTGNSRTAGVTLNAAGATFIMQGGSITENTTLENPNAAGAVWIGSGAEDNVCTFTMSGGIISNNRATGSTTISCGGVFLARKNIVFEKTGGIIYGGSATGGNANTALGTATNKGHAVLWERNWRKVDGDATHNISNVNNIGWD